MLIKTFKHSPYKSNIMGTTVITFFYRDIGGNSLYRVIPLNQQKIVYEWLNKLRFIDIVVDILFQKEEKYSYSLPLLFDSKPFILYSHYGILRIGKRPDVKLPDNFIDQWIKSIEKFTI